MRPELARWMEAHTRALCGVLQGHACWSSELEILEREGRELFTRSEVERLERETRWSSGPRHRAGVLLTARIRMGYIESASEPVRSEIRRTFLDEEISPSQGTHPLSAFRTALREAETDAVRQEIGGAIEISLARRSAMQEELRAREEHAARCLAASSYLDAIASWKGIDVAGLVRAADAILEATDTLWARALEREAEARMGRLPRSWIDLFALERGDRFDEHFAPEVLPKAISTWLGDEPGVRVDLELRPGKIERAFCAGIEIPGDVVLVVRPSSGARSFQETLHELGHAAHFAFVDRNLPWELRMLVDDVVAESFAFLMGGLSRNTVFLERVLGTAPAEYTRFSALNELMLVRRYCGKVKFEADVRTVSEPTWGEAYSTALERALGVEHPPALAGQDTDRGLAAFEYLQAWLISAQLSTHLETCFGEDWFERSAGRERLASWWRRGFELDGDALARDAGGDRLDPSPLVAHLKRWLS